MTKPTRSNRSATALDANRPTGEVEDRGSSPYLFAFLFFGLPLILIVTLEYLRLHG